MSIPGSAHPLLLSSLEEEGYFIERSLRFNSSDSAYLSRTPASAGNRRTWTYAFWAKITDTNFTSNATISILGANGSSQDFITLYNRQLRVSFNTASSGDTFTNAQLRDPAAWYHIVVAVDTTQATDTNRLKVYLNGVAQTFSYYGAPPLNYQTNINNATAQYLGYTPYYNTYFNGYLADIHFIDGQALEPTSFGEFDANGIWQPKAYTGTYGTNGFHLDFADNSSNTATTLGKDTSPNGNNWTPNNLSVTAGAGNDSLVDVPVNGAQTDTGAGAEVRGNYATFNPLRGDGYIGGLTNGNLDVRAAATGNDFRPLSTIGVSSGKWYWEVTKTYAGSSSTDFIVGIANAASSGATYSSGSQRLDPIDTIYGVSIDFDTLTFAIKKDNVALYSTSIAQDTYFAFVDVFFFGAAASATINFGQRPFAYTAPSGFKALNTANLPAPVVTKPSTVMDVALYTGNGGNQSITLPGGFNPDLVWVKSRSNSQDHYLFDAIRGGAGILRSNTTGAETTGTTYLSFDTSGFSSLNGLSSNGYTYAAWAWDAGSSTVTNTVGSISSQVRANASAGFSVVTWTAANPGNNSVGHGLNVAPSFIIVRSRTITDDWFCYHRSLGKDKYINLNLTSAASTLSNYWNNFEPDSTKFGVYSSTSAGNNEGNMVAYVFAPVAGYSSFGSYTGNGSTDGPFVYTGFRPAFLIIKRADADGNWYMYDKARLGYNPRNEQLTANISDAEYDAVSYPNQDFLSNGFKIRTTNPERNANASLYIYFAFAESPFQYARAR